MGDVKRAGEIIAGPLPAKNLDARTVEAFLVVNAWRDAHTYPMRSIRSQIAAYIRALGLDGFTAARLKRMQAIRRKLGRIGLSLHQIQDLGGCRAILGSIDEVDRLAQALANRSRHALRKENDYIASPKSRDGYRSRHLIFEYRGQGAKEDYSGRRIEVQLRTRLQHSWATAVEAVGLFRGEDLKGNRGDDDWLRLFKLMSAEFALSEGCEEVADVPPHKERVIEIRALADALRAAETLDNLSTAVQWTELAVRGKDRPTYYLIAYDNATNQVAVEPHINPARATNAYHEAERLNDNGRNIVLVEAGKVDQLKAAYPNYFGDVQAFRRNLRAIIKGKRARDFAMKPQETAPLPRREGPGDVNLLRRRHRWVDP